MHAEHLYMGKKKEEEFSWFLAQKKKNTVERIFKDLV
jgi:hypothetical protein